MVKQTWENSNTQTVCPADDSEDCVCTPLPPNNPGKPVLDDNNNAMVLGTNVIMNRQMEIVGFPGNKVINEKDAMDDL